MIKIQNEDWNLLGFWLGLVSPQPVIFKTCPAEIVEMNKNTLNVLRLPIVISNWLRQIFILVGLVGMISVIFKLVTCNTLSL